MKTRLRLIRVRPNLYMINDNPNVIIGIVDCSDCNRRIALKDDYHKKRMGIHAHTPVEFNYLETLAKTLIIPARQNQFLQENNFNNAPVRRIAIAMNTSSAITGSYNSKGLYAHKTYISNNFKRATSEYKGVLHCKGYDYEEIPDEIMEAPLSEPFFTWRMKLLSRPDGFMLYGKLGWTFSPLLNYYIQT